MTYRRRPLLPAVVGPRAAALFRREVGLSLEQKVAVWASSGVDDHRELAREVRAALDSLAESERQWRARLDGSDDGTTEPAVPAGHALSDSPLGGPELTAQEVAGRYRVSVEYVRRLCREGGTALAGRQPDGSTTWLIDAASAAEWNERRTGRG